MKKISDKKIKIGSNTIPVSVYSIYENEKINFSRVYVIASDNNGDIALIYNSKRDIWGFPGGHPNENESFEKAAKRECVEEIKYSIKNCEARFVLSNKIDGQEEEFQIICFAKIDKKSTEFVDEDESVSEIKFVKTSDVQKEIGNEGLWEEIIQGYRDWLNN